MFLEHSRNPKGSLNDTYKVLITNPVAAAVKAGPPTASGPLHILATTTRLNSFNDLQINIFFKKMSFLKDHKFILIIKHVGRTKTILEAIYFLVYFPSKWLNHAIKNISQTNDHCPPKPNYW